MRQNFSFTVAVVSEKENLVRVGAAAQPYDVAYPIGGNLVSVSCFEGLAEEERKGWFQFEVCGSPGYPAYYNFDTSAAIDGQTGTVVMPRAVHLGSYLRQSDADHPHNVFFLSIIEGGDRRRYKANHADLFIQAEHKLPPGTILYADVAAFKAFTAWSPTALKNSQDPALTLPDVVHAGVFILECSDDEMFDAAVVDHGCAAVDSCDAAVVPTSSSSSSSDSDQAAGGVSCSRPFARYSTA